MLFLNSVGRLYRIERRSSDSEALANGSFIDLDSIRANESRSFSLETQVTGNSRHHIESAIDAREPYRDAKWHCN